MIKQNLPARVPVFRNRNVHVVQPKQEKRRHSVTAGAVGQQQQSPPARHRALSSVPAPDARRQKQDILRHSVTAGAVGVQQHIRPARHRAWSSVPAPDARKQKQDILRHSDTIILLSGRLTSRLPARQRVQSQSTAHAVTQRQK